MKNASYHALTRPGLFPTGKKTPVSDSSSCTIITFGECPVLRYHNTAVLFRKETSLSKVRPEIIRHTRVPIQRIEMVLHLPDCIRLIFIAKLHVS